jgi:lipopolysaccharide export system permease protein
MNVFFKRNAFNVAPAPYLGEKGRSVSLTIFKYILGEAFFSFFVSFLFFFFIFFVNQILLMTRDILTKHVPVDQVALLVLFSLPGVIALSAPFASLVGTLMTVGRLTSDNEILVMLSSGLSYRTVFFPAIAVGIIVSLGSFFTNDVLLPAGTIEFARLWRRILLSTPALELQGNSVKRFRDTVIITGNVTGTAIDNIMIIDTTSDGERRIITASSAELLDAGKTGLILDLEDAFIQSTRETARDDYDYARTEFLRYFVPQEDLMQTVSSVTPREMSSRDVYREILQKKAVLGERFTEELANISLQAQNLENILRSGPAGVDWNQKNAGISRFNREAVLIEDIKMDRSLAIYTIEYYRKFSIPFGALSFVFLAVALGLMTKKNGQTFGFIIGLFISVVYWTLLLGGQTMGFRMSVSPFWSIWLPNILCLVAGIILTVVRVRK